MSDSEYNELSGEASVLHSKGQHYLEIANAITRSAASLDRIADTSEMTSKAVTAVRASSAKVSEDIKKAQARYRETAEALMAYAGALAAAKSDAQTAIRGMNAAENSVDDAVTARKQVESTPNEDPALQQTAADNAGDDVVTATAVLSGYQQDWRDARAAKNSAAGAAIDRIIGVTEGDVGDRLKDDGWDNWGSKIVDALKVIGKWAGILAIFLSWVPVLGQALLILAAIGAVLTLIDSIVDVIAGDGTLLDVLGATVAVVLTFFGGALISHLGKLAKSAVLAKNLKSLARTKDMAGLNRLKGTLGIKKGGSIAPSAMTAGKRMKFGVKDLLLEPIKGLKGKKIPLSDLTPKFLLNKLVVDPALGKVKVNKDTVMALRLALANPKLLDSMTLTRLGLAVGVHGAQTTNAVIQFDFSDPASYKAGPVGDGIDAVPETVDVIRRFQDG